MNCVDFLLENIKTLTFDDKLKIKNLGPDQPNIRIIQSDKKVNRTFNKDWYNKKLWLTASVLKKSLFCFPCLLFGGENVWTRTGYSDMKHLTAALSRHEVSVSHFDNIIKLKLATLQTKLTTFIKT